MSLPNPRCIEVCNHLLRGELSAVEAYDLALRRFEQIPEALGMERIRDEHRESASVLFRSVMEMGGDPAEEAGLWGEVVSVIQTAASLLGEQSVVAALRQGEKLGLAEYGEALRDEDVTEGCKEVIKHHLMPRLEEHVTALTNAKA